MHLRRRSRRQSLIAVVAAYLGVVILASSAAIPAAADELDSLHARILQHPGNPELNIRFAQLAETSGKLR
jgi:hypothetical protein